MAFGLQTYNSDGLLKLDISSRIIRTVSTVTLTCPPYGYGFVPAPTGTASNWVATGYMDYNGALRQIFVTQTATGCYPYTGVNASVPVTITFTGF